MITLEQKIDPTKSSLLSFIKTNRGKSFDRFNPINEFVGQIKASGAWTYAQALTGPIGPWAQLAGQHPDHLLENFACTDYLGLAQHPEVHRAVLECVEEYGVHTSASPTFTGNTSLGKSLETMLSQILGKDCALLYTTGWGANYGAIVGLANRDGADHFFVDAHAHNCLRTAVETVKGRDYQNFRHNDCDDLETKLKKCRQWDAHNGIFIVIDSLYSMKSSAPDLPRILQLANEYEAFVILDVAHDFGAIGNGLGVLETIDLAQADRLIISGCFSKSLGTNGGFVAGNRAIYHQLMLYSPTYIFSTGIDPIPCAIAKRSLEIAFSPEGQYLRARLASNIEHAHQCFTDAGFEVLGNVKSAIVPVLMGHEKVARLVTRNLMESGLLVNRAEFPAVGRRESILRFTLMATHEKFQIDRATEMLKSAWEYAQEELSEEI
ncbi:MAG: pyridoxal phosphate-dependent aminotransferase family protein [Saprospiraceae bacterium]|nr:pyridoxal phosphate-dependent aminotransferase family protein [Saprospiraceae bacterium]